jgi:hypothetical protein
VIDTRTGTRSNGKVKERLPPCAIRDKRFCCKHLRSREGVVYYVPLHFHAPKVHRGILCLWGKAVRC